MAQFSRTFRAGHQIEHASLDVRAANVARNLSHTLSSLDIAYSVSGE